MPTGYTHKIKDGLTFRQFALDCARAFDACVMLRDEPGGGENIPERFEPASHYKDWADEARSELLGLEGLTEAEAAARAQAEFRDAMASNERSVREKRKLRSKYEAMLADVRAWQPPTSKHEGMKKFMVEQLVESINCDCQEYERETVKQRTGAQWLTENIGRQRELVAKYEAEHAKEIELVEGRNRWIADLRGSLPEAR